MALRPSAGPSSAPIRVSVLVTAYQHARYIARALDSVLEQDEAVSFEILVGDDASTDGTRGIISEYATAHRDRIQIVFPESNLGLDGKALLNELLERARGEYVAMLDGDDHWTSPVKLRRQVAYLDEHPECSMCFHDVVWRHEDGSVPDVAYNGGDRPTEVTLHELVAGNPVASCSPVIRRQAIDPLPAWFFEQPWGDWQLYVIAGKHGKIHYLPDLMGVHLTHPNGMWSRLSRLEGLEGIARCQEGMRGFVPPEVEWRRRQALADTWVKRAAEHARLGDHAGARRCLRESFRVRPFDARRLRRGGGERRRIALWLRTNVVEALWGRRALLRRAQRWRRSAGQRR
ncbi:MAG: glycosyltransferase [Chloroflexota bacterium]|nr:glycosyltransferase [Chloroflexota bacterium]